MSDCPTSPTNFDRSVSDEEVARQLQKQLNMEYESEKKKRREATSNTRARSTRSKRNARRSDSDDVVLINESESTVGKNISGAFGRGIDAGSKDDVIVCDDVVDMRCNNICSREQVVQHEKLTSSSEHCRLNQSSAGNNRNKRDLENNTVHRNLQGQGREVQGQGYDEDLDRAIALSLQDVKQLSDSRNSQQRHGTKRPGSGLYDDPPVKVPCSVSSTRTISSSPSHNGKSVPSHSATSSMPASDSGIVGTSWYKKLFAADSSNKAKLESKKQLQRVREEQNEKYQSQKSAPRSSLFGSKHTTAWQDSLDDVVQLDSDGYLMYDQSSTDRHSHKAHHTPIRNQPSCSSSLIGQNSSNKEWKFSSSPRKDFSSSSAIGQSSPCKDWTFDSKKSVLTNEKEGNSTLTQSESLAKTKCGNCQMIGHKRTWERCPNYFSLEEVKRRQEQADKMRERIEAKERADQEVKDNLEQHHKRLANIAAAITAERERVEGTIQSIDKRKKVREKQRSKRGRR